MVEQATCQLRILLVGSEEGSQGAVLLPSLHLCNHICHIRLMSRIEDNWLLVWQVDLEFDNCRFLGMHVELKQLPAGLRGSDESGIQIVFDLIVVSAEFNRGPAPSLVDIFVDIFDRFEGEDRFHIDVTLVFGKQIGRVRDHKTVVNMVRMAHWMLNASIPAPVAGI